MFTGSGGEGGAGGGGGALGGETVSGASLPHAVGSANALNTIASATVLIDRIFEN